MEHYFIELKDIIQTTTGGQEQTDYDYQFNTPDLAGNLE